MSRLNEEIEKIVSRDKLEAISMLYKTRMLKQPNKQINLLNMFRAKKIPISRYKKLVAVIGGAQALHEYLSRTIDIEKDALHELLQETIEAQRKALPDMSAKERNDLLAILIKTQSTDTPQTQINFNMDSFLKEKDAHILELTDES